ncbi:MAG TPA: helix-turn-helix domain-containing protein [bacterium]|nr:helix-turn-helix domain-containing protein [bacterium]
MVMQLAFHKRSAHTGAVERQPRSRCPVSLALDAIGDKWSLLILRDITLREKRRYHEFLNSEEGISTNILADRLARLERQGLISKSADPDDRRQFVYAPTQKGLDLLPVVFEMARWSLKYSRAADRKPFSGRLRPVDAERMKQAMAQYVASRGGDREPHRRVTRKRPA